MGKKYPPQAFVGIPAGKFFCRGDGFGELKPDGEFPVAIPSRGPGGIILTSRGLISEVLVGNVVHLLLTTAVPTGV
jgi:hypothetical protein